MLLLTTVMIFHVASDWGKEQKKDVLLMALSGLSQHLIPLLFDSLESFAFPYSFFLLLFTKIVLLYCG